MTDKYDLIKHLKTNIGDKQWLKDRGMMERFKIFYGDIYHYCSGLKKWLMWNGKYWQKVEDDRIHEDIIQIVDDLKDELDYYPLQHNLSESKNKTITNIRESIGKAIGRYADEKYRKAIYRDVKDAGGLRIDIEKLDNIDQCKYLLNLSNGVLNLKTAKISKHQPLYYITKNINISHKQESKCPKWIHFLNEIMDFDQKLVDFLQRAIGYSLSGDTDERKMFILYGKGCNGKSIFLDTIHMILGNDYATRTSTETLLLKHSSEASHDIARLKGIRFVSASEVPQGRTLAESLIKDMTGGERISARHLYCEYFNFYPEFKLWLSTNHKPRIKGTDDAIWDRILLIPFSIRFDGGRAIPKHKLMNKFIKEKEGILNWMIQGFKEWEENNLDPPDIIKIAVEEYRHTEDYFFEFIKDKCDITNPEEKIKAAVFYQAYLDWAEEQNIAERRRYSNTSFGRAMIERFERGHDEGGNYYKGVQLKINELSFQTEEAFSDEPNSF